MSTALRNTRYSVNLGQALVIFVAFAIFFTAIWCQLSKASPILLGALIVTMVAGLFLLKERIQLELNWPLSSPDRVSWVIGILMPLPILAYFLLVAHQEFPFAGDHDHHLYMSHYMLGILGWYPLCVLVSIPATAWLALRLPYVWLAWLAAIIWISTAFPSFEFVARYPAGLYTLASPLNALLSLTGAHPILGTQITNILAVPIWLWILRPLLVGRWPDITGFLLGIFFFQRDFIHFTTTNHLEPWAVVFVLLSIELCLDGRFRKAALMAAVGCLFKEQAIFMLAVSAGMFFPRKSLRRIPEWTIFTALLALPFLIYWSIRNNAGVFRKVSVISPIDALQSDSFQVFLAHLNDQLKLPGWIALALIFSTLIYALASARGHRGLLLILMGAFLGPELLYLHDTISRDYIGYFRFHMLHAPILLSGAVLLTRFRVTIAVACAVLFSWTSVPFIYSATQPDYTRNYAEYYATPVFFPVRRLLSQLPESGLLTLTVFVPVREPWFQYSFGAGYGLDLQRFVSVDLRTELSCSCIVSGQALLLLDVYQPKDEPRKRVTPLHETSKRRACLELMQKTCEKVIVETAPDQAFVGAIGYRRN